MRRLLAALLVALALPAFAGERVDGFAVLEGGTGVVVTGLDGVPAPAARAVVAGFLDALGSGGAGADLLRAGRVLVVRGHAAAVGGATPGLVIDWRVSVDGGGDLGALYTLVEGVALWSGLDPARAAAAGREAGAGFLAAFTE